MADFNTLWWDEDIDKGLPGTGMNKNVMATITPSLVSPEDQFIVPIPQNNRGFTVKGGTYIRISLPKDGGGYDHWLFGGETDLVLQFAEQRLDTGVSFAPGQNYYIYLCFQAATEENPLPKADIVVSLNSTWPSGYDANTSRKIGGFHTLCASVPDDAANADSALKGFNAGDILPMSFWDLKHCSEGLQEGTVFDPRLKVWDWIYMQSGSGANSRSVFGGTITDSQTYSQHIEDLMMVGCTPLTDEEFSSGAEGSNQKTNIAGSADPKTTGAHKDTAGRRMVSDIGLEDCCGAMYQWISGCLSGGSASWVADGNKGSVYAALAVLAGGAWSSGASCGSRCRYAGYSRLTVHANCGCRGRARSRASR